MLNPFRTGLGMRREDEDAEQGDKPQPVQDDQLDAVSGGADNAVVSPRDPASGLPTGKRQH